MRSISIFTFLKIRRRPKNYNRAYHIKYIYIFFFFYLAGLPAVFTTRLSGWLNWFARRLECLFFFRFFFLFPLQGLATTIALLCTRPQYHLSNWKKRQTWFFLKKFSVVSLIYLQSLIFSLVKKNYLSNRNFNFKHDFSTCLYGYINSKFL